MKKIDFTMEKQNGVDVIKYVLGAADVFDERVSDKASELPNVIPFQYQDVDGKRTYTAYAHEDTTLDAYMKNTLTKPQVLGVLGGLAAIFEIGTRGIPVGYIVKDTSYIYVNTDNITVKAVVFPLKQDNMPLSEIPAFFREVISNMKFHEADVDNYVARIITQINADDFTAGNFKTFINAEMEKIGMFIHKDNGPMNMMVGGGKTPNKDVKVSKVGVMNNMNNMRPMQGAPMGQPMPPMGQPMPPMGQPMPPMGRPMPPMGQPMPPMGRPMPPQGQPMPPQGQPVPPMGQPVPPMGASTGMPAMPGMKPQAPVPQGVPTPVGMPGMPPQASAPQGAPTPVGMPGMPPQGVPVPTEMPPIGQSAQESIQPEVKDEAVSKMEEVVEKVENKVEEAKEEIAKDKIEEVKEEKIEEVADTIEEISEDVEKKVADEMSGMPGMKPQGAPMPAGMPPMPGMPGMKPQGAPMPAAPTGMPAMPGMPGMPPQGAPMPAAPAPTGMPPMPGMPPQGAPMPVAPAPTGMPGMSGMKPQGAPMPVAPAPTGMPPMSGMPGMKPQGAPMPAAPEPVAPAPQPVAPVPQPVAPVPQPVAPVPEEKSEQPAPVSQSPQGGMVGNLVGKLGDKPVPHLIRKKTGETINLSKPEFTLGKAVGKVDYAITDNTAVSRIHCIIEQKNGVNYIKDNGSTNHTYLDGVELEPQKETLLKNKMTILLGDEEFTFLLRRGE